MTHAEAPVRLAPNPSMVWRVADVSTEIWFAAAPLEPSSAGMQPTDKSPSPMLSSPV